MQTDGLELYFARVRPIYRDLFAMAHAICGNYEAAEFALQETIQDGWTFRGKGRTRAGFRELMRERLCANALREVSRGDNEDIELTWTAFEPAYELDAMEADAEDGDPVADALRAEIARETLENRRLLVLVYGCGLSQKAAARLLGLAAKDAQAALERFEASARRRLPARHRRQWEASIAGVIHTEMVRPNANVPDPGSVYRRFEAEVSQGRRAGHRWLGRLVNAVTIVVLAALCCGLFWLVAVLMQPAPEEAPAEAAGEMFTLPAWDAAEPGAGD